MNLEINTLVIIVLDTSVVTNNLVIFILVVIDEIINITVCVNDNDVIVMDNDYFVYDF